VWGQGGEMTQALYAHMNKKINTRNFFFGIMSIVGKQGRK
jgi:hypothetical protein